ncbi:MAG: phosphoribosyltransferase family protein [Rikenellaceae bacterium]|nr:phosphoribosyltransferase family protein [Rikenellaceae bacterium]
MSILSSGIADLLALFFPERCLVCGAPLARGERAICTLCRVTAPLTNYEIEAMNPVLEKLEGLVPVERASAMLFFQQGSGWQRLIHDFKYYDRWRAASEVGRWYGTRLKQSGLYEDIDVVVPLPLHPFKLLRRGYNQATYLAEGIARELGVEVLHRAVRRTRNTKSQARKPRREREANVAGAFAVRHAEQLRGRHILVVDDVLTTGSTLTALVEAIVAEVPDCRISVAVLAVPRGALGVKV